jgi:hypothetical protein
LNGLGVVLLGGLVEMRYWSLVQPKVVQKLGNDYAAAAATATATATTAAAAAIDIFIAAAERGCGE